MGTRDMLDEAPIDIDSMVEQTCRAARAAARRLAVTSGDDRRTALGAMAESISDGTPAILAANEKDMDAGRTAGLSSALLDRLRLDDDRISAMARGLRDIAALADPIGETIETIRPTSGIVIRKRRVPLGVIGMIYESRPNVTADAGGLCLMAGNAVILRGGTEALHSNVAILTTMHGALSRFESMRDAVQMLGTTDRAAVRSLLQMDRYVDLIIPRGGEGLIRMVAEHSKVPVLKHYKGVCHVYVDAEADEQMGIDIVVNAKCQRPGVCNAMETLLIHEALGDDFVRRICGALSDRGVEIRGDDRVCAVVEGADPATEEDWSAEYLDLIASVRIVPDIDTAIDHIEAHGSRHSDVIITRNHESARRFLSEVDSATVYHNASSRFTDGAEFEMGAEIGISTDKLHARGPCGIRELTTYKYVIEGAGQVRKEATNRGSGEATEGRGM